MNNLRSISVIGLGYVGLPLAIAFSKQGFSVLGFDKSERRIAELKQGFDKTREITTEELKSSSVHFSHEAQNLKSANFHIIAVPTPVDDAHTPNISLLHQASTTLGLHLKKGDIVVYESTVYPGVTEEICVPILEKTSGLICGKDFKVGYSPERINPGDKIHTLENVVKIVAGQDEETLEIIANTYGCIVKAGVFKANSIQVAEAAKVIENTQRDLNIALVNELALIFNRMNIDTQEVLMAASTKWNFIPFKPGLVGGHCIGVDPYYLTYRAQQFGYHPEVILAGRRINDNMGKYIAEQTIKHMIQQGCTIKNENVAVLGLTFKENCSDLRNSRSFDIINELKTYHINVQIHDPLGDAEDTYKYCGLQLTKWEELKNLGAVIICVAHDFYKNKEFELLNMTHDKGTITDVKAVIDQKILPAHSVLIWKL